MTYNLRMRLYLVRHGKTDVHLEKRRQSPESPLGIVGKEQALAVAKRLKEIKADVLLTSNWPRAIQTAEIISKEIGLPIVINPELHEQNKSKLVDDVLDDSEINLRFLEERSKSAEELNFDWKFEGEGESMSELLLRAGTVCRSLAEEYKNKKIIAVTHGIFIVALVTTMIFGSEPDKKTVINFFRVFTHHNAGITVLDYDEERNWWSLVSLNDHSHLS